MKNKLNSGFTLVEIIISIGILVPAIIVSYQIIFNFYESYNTFIDLKNINYIARTYLEKFEKKDFESHKSLYEEIKLDKRIYKVDVKIARLNLKNYLSEDALKEISEQYVTYLKFADDISELKIIIINPLQQEYEFKKLVFVK